MPSFSPKPVDGEPEAFVGFDARLPPEKGSRSPDIRLADLGVVDREWTEHDLAAGAGKPDDALGELQQCHLLRIANVDGVVHRSLHESPQPVDEIGDVLKRTRLCAVTKDSDGRTGQGLAHERGNRAPVLEPHARPERVEDPNDARIDPVIAVVCHRDRFAEALGFVVHAPRPNRIDVSPVVLALGMHERVAVHLGSRGEQEPRALSLRDAEGIVGTERADLQRLNRQLQIVEGRRGTREVQDPVEVTVEANVLGDVVLDEREAGPRLHGREVLPGSGDEVVHTDDVPALAEEELTEVRADEPRSARDERPA